LDTAQLHYKLQQYNKARDVVLRILQKQPENGDAHHMLGMIYLSDGEVTTPPTKVRGIYAVFARDCSPNLIILRDAFRSRSMINPQ